MSDTSPLVSVLMAVYNAESYLEQALQSLQAQTMPRWEVLCVDDASTDSSALILQRYAQMDPRIRVFRQPHNQGQAVARNLALPHCRGQYVAMLDADDWYSADALEQVVRQFSEHPDTDAVLFDVVMHEQESGQQHSYPIPYPSDYVLSGHDAFVDSLDWTLHGIYVVRTQLHQRYPYDTACHLYSDDNTTRLHYLHSRQVRFCQGRYYYRQHAASATHAVSMDRFLYMEANLSMQHTLQQEAVPAQILQMYENHRWLNYIDQLWFYHQHRHRFTQQQRQSLQTRFRQVYGTFHRPYRIKFGYTWLPSYNMFRMQTWIYFTLKQWHEKNNQ